MLCYLLSKMYFFVQMNYLTITVCKKYHTLCRSATLGKVLVLKILDFVSQKSNFHWLHDKKKRRPKPSQLPQKAVLDDTQEYSLTAALWQ